MFLSFCDNGYYVDLYWMELLVADVYDTLWRKDVASGLTGVLTHKQKIGWPTTFSLTGMQELVRDRFRN